MKHYTKNKKKQIYSLNNAGIEVDAIMPLLFPMSAGQLTTIKGCAL